jgi:ribosomal protein L35
MGGGSGWLIARGWAATAWCSSSALGSNIIRSSSILGTSSSSALNNSSSAAAAVGAQLHVTRGLLGLARTRPARVNYQDHNQTKPKRLKIKTRSVVKRRVIVAKDGTMWRTQAGRRHKRTKKSGGRLRELRGLAPLADGWARKLRKLGYKRRWWYSEKA